ncbi:MAG: DUF669 domain-containing protein [Deltaproteobacteria bacterium]|jgi:hypothetical protein|nr:DUF669 domain-containing protein [Deltaproteobacteria bacterium]
MPFYIDSDNPRHGEGDDWSRPDLLPEGRYSAKIIKADIKPAKNDNRFVDLWATVTAGVPEYEGCLIQERLFIDGSEKAMKRTEIILEKLFKALGKESATQVLSLKDLPKLIGQVCVFNLVVQKQYNSEKEENAVDTFNPFSAMPKKTGGMPTGKPSTAPAKAAAPSGASAAPTGSAAPGGAAKTASAQAKTPPKKAAAVQTEEAVAASTVDEEALAAVAADEEALAAIEADEVAVAVAPDDLPTDADLPDAGEVGADDADLPF